MFVREAFKMMVGAEPRYSSQLDIILSNSSKCIEYTDLDNIEKSEMFETCSQLDEFSRVQKGIVDQKETLDAFRYAFWLEHERDKREYDPLLWKRKVSACDSHNNERQITLRCVDFPNSFFNLYSSTHAKLLSWVWNVRQVSEENILVLCLDGGGLSSIISALILQEIDSMCKGELMGHVSHVIGTSMGAVLAFGLSHEGSSRPRTPKEMVDIYERLGKKVFQPNMEHDLLFNGSKHLSNTVEQVIENEFSLKKNTSLCSVRCTPHFACVTHKEEGSEPFLFRSYDARHTRPSGTTSGKQIPATAALRATLSTSSCSKPIQLGAHKFIGGCADSNPTLLAIKEVVQLYPNIKKMGLISIGTGCFASDPIGINSTFKEEEKVHQQVKDCLTDLKNTKSKFSYQYWRLNPKLDKNFDFSPEEWIEVTKQVVNHYTKEKKSVIEDICNSLRQYKGIESKTPKDVVEVDKEIVDAAIENRIQVQLFNLKGSCTGIVVTVASKDEMWKEIREYAKCIIPSIDVIVEYHNPRKIISNPTFLKDAEKYYALERKEWETFVENI